MVDRNPIKFGPEWLRNLARESASNSAANQTAGPMAPGMASLPTAGAGATAASNTSPSPTVFNTSKVQLAKLRYGREEMLALYDRNSEAPSELKYNDLLYQPRGKPPVALNNSFEDEMREAMRAGPTTGTTPPGERFGMGRGVGRSVNATDPRVRPRLPFTRPITTGRSVSWHSGAPRMPGFTGTPEEERPWTNNNQGNAPARAFNVLDPNEFVPNKMLRRKTASTNWRQPTREEGEEWRSDPRGGNRSGQQDKWERDWSERPNLEKQHSWNSNRRGRDSQNEENLPEWAMDNAEACAGTFDSSGAFHGYSNDDTNLPKNQEPVYPLTRSHTHGSFGRSKTVEEGSDEWWTSEKAKKLSPKRFDASDIQFKKLNTTTSGQPGSSNAKPAVSKEEVGVIQKEPPAGNLEQTENNNPDDNSPTVKFSESKTFDALMRSDIINIEEANDDRGNFQSVMINPNNSLRQKHQNIVPSIATGNPAKYKSSNLYKIFKTSNNMMAEQVNSDHIPEDNSIPLGNGDNTSSTPQFSSNLLQRVYDLHYTKQLKQQAPDDKTLDELIDNMSLVDEEILPNMHLDSERATTPRMPATVMPPPAMQPAGLTEIAERLNASLRLPLAANNSLNKAMGIPIQGVPSPVMPAAGFAQPLAGALGRPALQPGMPGFSNSAHPGNGASLFMGHNNNNHQMPSSNDIQMLNHGNPTNMFPMHGLQQSGPSAAYGTQLYNSMNPQPKTPTTPNPAAIDLTDRWFYEDPKRNVQGPFSSSEMLNWYRAGFFSPSLMVRRACDTVMRPLGSYGPEVPFGPVVPFGQVQDVMFPMSGGFESRGPAAHDPVRNNQPGLGLDIMSTITDSNSMDPVQLGQGPTRNPQFGQQQMVDSLWSQPPEMMWMQQPMNARNEARVNNLPMYFWDQQTSMSSNSILPEGKEMKTEDQILAQLRASQNLNNAQKLMYMGDPQQGAPMPPGKPEDGFHVAAPNLEDLQKIIQEDSLHDVRSSVIVDNKPEKHDLHAKENTPPEDQISVPQPVQNKTVLETKVNKQLKPETDKSIKNKDNSATKTKSKKSKEDKREDSTEKTREEDKAEKRSEESSPSKKKDDKQNRKDLENEKKEWIKEGFTIVNTAKGAEKSTSKDKKKVEEVKAAEEAERKRKEEEKLLLAEEERKRKQAEALKKQQELQLQQQRQAAESVSKKAPWSSVANQALQATSQEGMTLAEIQRLEREKKLEQMKEQQQMMQIIAQQQAAALAREQEMQMGLGWAKKKNTSVQEKSLAEIQAEARKQAAAAAAAVATQVTEEPTPVLQTNHVPWASITHNGGSIWDSPAPAPVVKSQAPQKVAEQPVAKASKKKVTTNQAAKKDVSPAAEFDTWCTTVLASWSAKIDVPTFVGFLKDIESPYEVKDYVKCYLGESKDSNDFARQFLERRSKLLRVGMVTPSDDLCSPAMAVNPRTSACSEYQEVKGKKKKNKMLKVDVRILGFSVTAAEDRINVGDIDTV